MKSSAPGPARALLRPFLAALLLLPACAGVASAQSRDSYFNAVDTDRDGRISLPEYLERMSWAFHEMDRDRNQVLTPDEQLVAGAPTLTLADLHRRLSGQFKRQDRNRDGALSPAEYLAPPA